MRTFSLRRRLPTSSKVFLTLAVVCALTSFVLVRAQGARAAGGVAGGPTLPVVVAARALPPGVTLGAGDVRLQELPPAAVPSGALTAPEEAAGRVTTGAIGAGEVLTQGRVASSLLSGGVALGQVAVTATFASIPDGLSTVDRVDVYATFGGARPFTTLAGEDLRILRIGAAEEGGLGQDRGTRVTLAVDPATARQLVEADATGTLALAVRGAAVVTASPSPTASPEVLPVGTAG